MNPKFSLAAAAFAAFLSLTACGGGGSSSSASTAVAVASPATFSYVDNVVGTGAKASAGSTASVTYTGWLYSDTASDHKGTQFDSGSFALKLGSGQAITGFDQGVQNMLVGGTRTLYIPSSLAYGSTGQGTIPPNAGLVFTVTLVAVQ